MLRIAILRKYRTEHAKEFRRKYGDLGGCRFSDKYMRMASDNCSNTISTVTKDNLLCAEYE